jgi:TolB-like protein
LKRILNSPDFVATQRSKDFLRFVVEETLAGRGDTLKAYTIATRVFGREKDFDPLLDPIVRVQAGKLRRVLERYYLVTGDPAHVRIDIPKGAYLPVFEQEDPIESASAEEDESKQLDFAATWPTILIKPFLNLTGAAELDYLGIGLATELSMEITRYHEIRVLLMPIPEGEQRRDSHAGARFVLEGNIQRGVSGLKVSVSLVDSSTGIQIWGDSHKTHCDPSQLIVFQEEVASTIAGRIACEYGIIAKTLSHSARRNPPSKSKTYEAMLRYYEFNARFTAATFFDAYEALQHASRNEPDCGLVWSMLARLYATNYSLELFDLKTPLEEAVSFAERGVQLEPANQRTRLIMAFVRLFEDEIAAGLAETDRALALNPNSLVLLDSIGYLLTLFGEWQRGPALVRKAIRANPFYGSTAHYALYVDSVRRRDYQQAYSETRSFRTPLLFWEPLMKAAASGLLGRAKEGKHAVDALLELKPDFAKRGRTLIERYIKFGDIVDRVLEGLGKAGLNVA